jgi:hypothetical protein
MGTAPVFWNSFSIIFHIGFPSPLVFHTLPKCADHLETGLGLPERVFSLPWLLSSSLQTGFWFGGIG